MSVPMTSIFDGTGLIKNASTMDNLGELTDIDPPRELQQATNTLNTVAQTNQTDSQMISMVAQVTSIDTAGEMANKGYAPSSEEQREEVKTMDDDDEDEDESHDSLYDDNLCQRGETAGGDTTGGDTAGMALHQSTCKDCGLLKAGKASGDSGYFYCNDCWVLNLYMIN
eukprot:669518_1